MCLIRFCDGIVPLINNIRKCPLCFNCIINNMMLINNMLVFNNNSLSQICEQSNSKPISEQTQKQHLPERNVYRDMLIILHFIIIRSLRLRFRERTRTNNIAFKGMNSNDDSLLLTFKNHRWRAVCGFC